MDTFGPNSWVIRRFLDRLRTLGAGEWRTTIELYRRSRDGFPSGIVEWLRWQLAWNAVRRAGRPEVKEAIAKEVQSLGLRDDVAQRQFDPLTIVYSAAFALAVRDLIAPRQFEILYHPIASAIPLQDLEKR